MANSAPRALASDDGAMCSAVSRMCTPSVSQGSTYMGSTGLPNFQLIQDLTTAQQMTPEEDPRAEKRRERNRLAAARCRERRRERAEFLRKETLQLENSNENLRANIGRLRRERERLKQVLASHMTTHHGEGAASVPQDQGVAHHGGGLPSCGHQGVVGAASEGQGAMALLQGVDSGIMGGTLLLLDSREASFRNEITYDLPQQPITYLSESRHRRSEETNS